MALIQQGRVNNDFQTLTRFDCADQFIDLSVKAGQLICFVFNWRRRYQAIHERDIRANRFAMDSQSWLNCVLFKHVRSC